MEAGFWFTLGQIVVVNLLLSGDNAAVIALAARHLAPPQRRWAVWGGSLAAVVLRVALTWVAASLLRLNGLAAAGGALLLWVAVRLVREGGADAEGAGPAAGGWAALRMILVADVLMSLDNVLSLAALARNDTLLLVLGLLTSLPLVVLGSSFLLALLDRYPWLVRLGGALLGEVAGSMMVHDPCWSLWTAPSELLLTWFPWICAAGIGLWPERR